MNKKQKDEQLKLFAKAFHEVVAPLLEGILKRVDIIEDNMATKEDLEDVATKGDIDRLERKIDATYLRADRQDKKMKNHGKRITVLESTSTISS